MAEIFTQDVRVSSATRQADLGEIKVGSDGRAWRYVKAGASAIAPGILTVTADAVANHGNIAVAVAAPVNATRVKVTLGATAATANQYAGGFLTVNDAAGEGITYKVAGHGAIGSAAAGWIELEEPIKVALTTSSEVTLESPFGGVVISATDQADLVAGVANAAIAAGEYGWVQVRGICAVLADEAVTKGAVVTIGTGVAGAVEAQDLIAEPIVGVAVEALVDTEYRSVDLLIA